MEVLRLFINVTGCQEVVSENRIVRMLSFDGACEGEFLKGTILPGGVDTQKLDKDGCGTLSARYMVQGVDSKGQPCHLFIENNAEVGGEQNFTTPTIVTDSQELKWLEAAQLRGRIETIEGQLTIIIETFPEEKVVGIEERL